MISRAEQLSKWFYHGLWGVLTRWFRVPDRPPQLPALSGESITAFQPDVGFLRYLLFQFWIGLLLIDGLIFVGWLAIAMVSPTAAAMLAIPALIVAVVPDVVVYLAVHLRFDTTWYVISDRSLRIRRGIWTIRETTLTFENIQNVTVRQGPLQRYFGIANLLVETAGGGPSGLDAHGAKTTSGHCGVIEGIADAQRIRELIMNRLRTSVTAGLGDETSRSSGGHVWNSAHVFVLREIRDAVRALASEGELNG
jgi:membrane protein YdbS with pleckstrin-like domain